MKRLLPAFLATLLILSVLPGISLAGGPLSLSGNASVQTWNPAVPMAYRVDLGGLGWFTREEAAAIIQYAFSLWEQVDTASITFSYEGYLGEDVDGTNFGPYFQNRYEHIPIIFDDDGSITDAFFGTGSRFSVLGFSMPLFPGEDGFYTYGAVVFNGVLADPENFTLTAVHELGHLAGLDHTQANRLEENAYVPVMYPYLLNGMTPEPKADDRAWLSWMYPVEGAAAATGSISGYAVRRSLLPFPAGHIVCRRSVPDGYGGFTGSKEEVVASISDYLVQGNGAYLLPYLAPGSYYVYLEPLQDAFTGGSGIGPFDLRFTDFPIDYYNGDQEAGDPAVDDPGDYQLVNVTAGQDTGGIVLISNNDLPEDRADPLAGLGDDDSVLFEFPTGFSFPFLGQAYGFAVVNSDGNLTLLLKDDSSDPRDTERMIDGPPRIAPLFTDLDLTRGGSVSAIPGEDRLSIVWEDVPEYSLSFPVPQGNTFAVTLFASGDVTMSYTQVNATPDDDNIHSIVGIAPGFFGRTTGDDMDLSQATDQDLVIGAAPLFQEFDGDTFDLAGQTLRFYAQDPGPEDPGDPEDPEDPEPPTTPLTTVRTQTTEDSGSGGGSCFIKSL